MSAGTIGVGPRSRGVDALSADMENLAVNESPVMVGADASSDMAPSRSIAHVTDLFGDFRVADNGHMGTVMITGYNTPVSIIIDRQTYEVDINFVYANAQYTFRVTRWSRNGMRLFLALFHEYENRDPIVFGTMDGVLTSSQKINCVLRASIDVMACLNKITTRIQSSVLDYAVYYRERKGSYETYSKYITTVTCHNIVHAHFMGGNISWPNIEF